MRFPNDFDSVTSYAEKRAPEKQVQLLSTETDTQSGRSHCGEECGALNTHLVKSNSSRSSSNSRKHCVWDWVWFAGKRKMKSTSLLLFG